MVSANFHLFVPFSVHFSWKQGQNAQKRKLGVTSTAFCEAGEVLGRLSEGQKFEWLAIFHRRLGIARMSLQLGINFAHFDRGGFQGTVKGLRPENEFSQITHLSCISPLTFSGSCRW